MEPAFVDTNVLVYALTSDDKRSAVAQELIASLLEAKALRTSTQVLQEFFAVVTRKLARPISSAEAMAHVHRFAICPVLVNDVASIEEAAQLSARGALSFWDGLIVAAAIRARCPVLYSEDLQHGRTIRGVKVMNPFVR
jgi:predicted nucleic acid-binding protein